MTVRPRLAVERLESLGPGLALVPAEVFEMLQAVPGDYFQLDGPRSTVALGWPYPGPISVGTKSGVPLWEQRPIIVDSLTWENLRAAKGEKVSLSVPVTVKAEEVMLEFVLEESSESASAGTLLEERVRQFLARRPLVPGEQFALARALSTRMQRFCVKECRPLATVAVVPKTKITFLGGSPDDTEYSKHGVRNRGMVRFESPTDQDPAD